MPHSFTRWLAEQTDSADEDVARLRSIVSKESGAPDIDVHGFRLWLVDQGATADIFDAVDRVATLWRAR